MILRPCFCVLFLVVTLVVPKLSTHAAVVFEHVGDNNPATEATPWSLHGVSGLPDSTGKPNWLTTWGSNSNYYRVVGTGPPPEGTSDIEKVFDDQSGWTATAEVQLVAADSFAEASFIPQDGTHQFSIRFFDGLGDDPLGAYAYVNYALIPLGTVDPTDDFHTYQIVLDAKDNTSRADDEIFYYVDGVVEYSILRSKVNPSPDRAELGMFKTGHGFDGTDAVMRHALWRLETGQNPIDPVVPPGGSVTIWNLDGAGLWSTASNWDSNEVPGSSEARVLLGDAITSPASVTVDTEFAVNNVEFDNANSYSVIGTGSINLSANSAATLPGVTVTAGDHRFAIDVKLVDDAMVDVASSSTLSFQTLELEGKTLTQSGLGRLDINGIATGVFGSVIASAGTVGGSGMVGGSLDNQGAIVAPGEEIGILNLADTYLQSSGGTLAIEVAGTGAAGDTNGHDQLSTAGAAMLDGALEVSATGFDGMRGQDYTIAVVTAVSQSGTFSSEPAAGAHLGFGLFAGDGQGGEVVSYDGTAVQFTYLAALEGDSDGDRDIDITDFNSLASNFDPDGNQSGSNDWTTADFDLDGDIDITDFNTLASHFAPGGYAAANAVPEPSAMLLGVLACMGAMIGSCGCKL